MFKVTADNLAQMPKAFRFAYYVFSGVRFASYKTWINEGEPNPFVARRASKEPMTHQDAHRILADIDPFVVIRQAVPEPRPITLVRAANGLMRPRHLREKRYQMAA